MWTVDVFGTRKRKTIATLSIDGVVFGLKRTLADEIDFSLIMTDHKVCVIYDWRMTYKKCVLNANRKHRLLY